MQSDLQEEEEDGAAAAAAAAAGESGYYHYHDFASASDRLDDDFLLLSMSQHSSSYWWKQAGLRLLAGGGDNVKSRIDYSVLSVGVMTLGLIMVVEVLRHRLDVAALGKPFFKAVLEGVYAELSTLGIVELFIWLLHSYYDDLDVAKELVFAKVHFTLFYTAIFTAFQTVIVAFFANRVSKHLWVRTEDLEINHYVEIREEFQKVSEKLNRMAAERQDRRRRRRQLLLRTSSSIHLGNEGAADESAHQQRAVNDNDNKNINDAIIHREREDSKIEQTLQRLVGRYERSSGSTSSSRNCCAGICRSIQLMGHNLLDQIQYPHLKGKYNQLLIQVRFHELRVHFLQAYKLPLKLKISDYLLRSQLAVLIRLVHVSMVAWLLLTGATNLLYFIMGIVSYETKNPEFVGKAMVAIYYASMGLFILMALALNQKMKSIFKHIMHQEILWDTDHDEAEKKQLAERQLSLFWFSDPNIVIASIQFMQFCYAIALSVVLIFWNTIEEGGIPMRWYFIIVAISYSVFVYVVAKVIPRYTLCTSLGQLVDEKRLHETLSIFHLQEAKLEEFEKKLAANHMNANPLPPSPATPTGDDTASNATGSIAAAAAAAAAAQLPISSGEDDQPSTPQSRTKSPGSAMIGSALSIASSAASTLVEVATGTGTRPTTPQSPAVDKTSAELMAELVRLDTSSLRTNLPEKEIGALKAREEREKGILERKRIRRRAVSDGVSAMARMSLAPIAAPLGGFASDVNKSAPTTTKDDTALGGGSQSTSLRDVERQSAMSARASPAELKPDDTIPENLIARRRHARRRMKTVSDGVALMATMPDELPFPGKKDSNAGLDETSQSTGSSSLSSRSGIIPAAKSRERRRPFKKSLSSGAKATSQMNTVDPFRGLAMDESARFVKDDSEVRINNSKNTRELFEASDAEPHWGANEERLKAGGGCFKADDAKQEIAPRARDRRRRRKKSVSDGVALMSRLSDDFPMNSLLLSGGELAEQILHEHEEEKAMEETPDIGRMVTASDTADFSIPAPPLTTSDAADISIPVPPLAPSSSMSVGSEGPPAPISPEMDFVVPSSIIKPISQHPLEGASSPGEGEESESQYVPDSLRTFVDEADKRLRESTTNFFVSAQTPTGDKTPPDTPVSSLLMEQPSTDELVEEFTEKHEDDTDILSTESVGGLSDIDDIPDVDFTQLHLEGPKERRTVRQVLKSYYLSERFVVISNVFGTMVAFFMIGQRVEGFLMAAGVTNVSEFVKFDFPTHITFWILFTWFLLFLITSSLIFYSLEPFSRLETNHERALFFSSIMDGMLTLSCLACLCVAEVQRCCYSDSDPERFLAGGEEEDYADGYLYKNKSELCSCPTFGSRLYGGYGNIEPFTSLIALRIFRHWAAKTVVVKLKSSFVPAKDDEDFMAKDRLKSDPFAVFGDKHTDGPMSEEKGTITELWETAVGRYPEIVAKHGEFSSELLRTMLGVPLDEGGSSSIQSASPTMNQTANVSSPISNLEPENTQPFSVEKQYSSLPLHAQEIILAGKLGRTVKGSAHQQFDPDGLHPAIPEEKEEFQGSPVNGQASNLLFKIDSESPQTQTDSLFASPNARLVRNMRRCDRKVLPFLDNFTVVDVVLTRNEMIYFDSVEAENAVVDVGSTAEGMKHALLGTRGGKGLRLCDVAVGRRVVGQLQLADILSVHVERIMPHQLRPSDGDVPAVEVRRTEYWHKRMAEEKTLTRGARWVTVKQDILKIKTVNGRTVCVRFYSDLEDAEAHFDRLSTENETEGPLHKNLALQWAQTIVRYCGPDQLKQNLPHFGDDSSDELRDFLIVKQDETKPKEARHRRIFSEGAGDRNRFFLRRADTKSADNTPRPTHHRSSSSVHIDGSPIGELSTSKPDQNKRSSFHYVGEFAKEVSGNGSLSPTDDPRLPDLEDGAGVSPSPKAEEKESIGDNQHQAGKDNQPPDHDSLQPKPEEGSNETTENDNPKVITTI